MLGIKIGTQSLDLNPDTALEVEQQNPFLQFSNELIGDYSLPFEVRTTPKNLRLLQYAGVLQKRIDQKGIDAGVFDGGLQHSIGKIKVEKPSVNLNNTNHGSLSCYYLSGVGSFYQDIKEVRLRNINVGGNRTFTAAGGYTRSNSGFWGHIHSVLDAPAGYGASGYDYAFYPVLNKGFRGTTKDDVVNHVSYTGGAVTFSRYTRDNVYYNLVCPFPYLKYVLLQAVNHVGWRIEGDILSDADFCKITLENFVCINYNFLGLGYGVTFNLQDHLPDVSVAEFMVALKNRFGWWYDFDRRNKIIRIKSLNDASVTAVKDISAQASPVVVKTVNKDKKIYALRQTAPGGVYNTDVPNWNLVQYLGEVPKKADLPAATESNSGGVYRVLSENNYYICRFETAYGWHLYTYGNLDYAPTGSNTDIATATVAVANEYFDSYYDWIPRVDQLGENPAIDETIGNSGFGIILSYYYGVRPNRNGTPLPQAGSGVYDSIGNRVTQWALTFECKTMDGDEVGLYNKQWLLMLSLLGDAEVLDLTVRLNRVEYMQLKFSDILSVKGVRLYVKTLKATIPYKGSVTITGIRI